MATPGKKKPPAKKPRTSPTSTASLSVRGVGFHFPDALMRTEDIVRTERPIQLFNQQMRGAIGCEAIHVAGPNDSPSTLASAAAERALENAGLEATELDLVVSVIRTPGDFDLWSQPAKVAQRIGATNAECLGIGDAGCAGAFAALRSVLPMMLAPEGPVRALIAAGCVTPGGHFFPPATIFGDGGGALILERNGAHKKLLPRVVRSDFYSHVHLVDAFGCQAGVDLLRAEGKLDRAWWTVGIRDHAVYSDLRVTNFDLGAQAIQTSLKKAGWRTDDLTWLVPDNVSSKVGDELALRIGLPKDRVLEENCSRYGHAFVADLFVNLRTILDLHPLERGDRLACVGMGLGQHWGVLLLEV